MKKRKKNKTKVIIRLEKDGRYIERTLTKRMVCALFDIQFMIDDGLTWDYLKLNHMEKDMEAFFKLISHIDENMHEPVHMSMKGKKWIKKKMKTKDYLFGKAKWREIK